jgi:hypothetical protein
VLKRDTPVAGHPDQAPAKSRLRSMEHVKEDGHAEATKRINERREQRHSRN